MANVLQSFKHLTAASARSMQNAIHLPTLKTQVRTLYSPSSLGLDAYIQQRNRTDAQLGNILEKFRTKMEEYASPDSKNMIFTEDLKNMIHLAQEDDIKLVVQMMNKFNEQNRQMRFGNFVFGPVVMRMFHHLNKPNEALECFTSSQLNGFFDQLISYQLIMDMLFEAKMYKEMLTTFEQIQSRQIEGTKYPRNMVVLTMAACYKINTEESCNYALALWNGLKEAGHFPMRRAATFCASLALNHKKSEAAMEILGSTKNQNYTTVRNLKALALLDLGRVDDAVAMLKSVLEMDTTVKHTYNKDVVVKIQEVVEKSGNAELQKEMERVMKYFKEQEHISDEALDAQLCEEIKPPPFIGNHRQYQNHGGYNRENPRYNNQYARYNRQQQFQQQYRPRIQRPGLNDIN